MSTNVTRFRFRPQNSRPKTSWGYYGSGQWHAAFWEVPVRRLDLVAWLCYDVCLLHLVTFQRPRKYGDQSLHAKLHVMSMSIWKVRLNWSYFFLWPNFRTSNIEIWMWLVYPLSIPMFFHHHELSILRISLWCWWPFRVQVGHPLRAAPAAAFLQEGPQRCRPTQFWSSLVVDLMALDALDGTGALPTERDWLVVINGD